MHGEEEFRSFVERFRAGDASAAEELVRHYEPIIRREIRFRMIDSRLTRIYDSVDFSQAVMASFFLRSADFEFKEPQDLVRLLITMARNKMATSARKLFSQKREGNRQEVGDAMLEQIADDRDTPSKVVGMLEMVAEAKKRLSPEERLLVEFRNQGKSWEDIANEIGGTAQGRRMQLARALERVTESLGIES
jgi:RNA polymerase sigma-70 factor (ECF subfamily)